MQAHGALFSGFLFSICMTFCDIKNIYIYHLSHVSLLPLSEPLRYLGFFLFILYISVVNYCDGGPIFHLPLVRVVGSRPEGS